MRRSLARLSPEHREVVVLHHLEGLPLSDIAATLGVAVGTVKSRLGRAREHLERLMRPVGLLVAQVDEAPPAELRARVLSALAPRASRRVIVWRLASVAAAVAVLATVTLSQRPPAVVAVAGDGQEAGSLVQQHATLASFDPLGDPTAQNAMGAVALRHEVLH